MLLEDPLLLTLVIFVTIILIIGNLYFIAHFSHHADNAIGSSTACKFIVVSFCRNNNFSFLDDCIYFVRMLDPPASPWCHKCQRGWKYWYVQVLVDHLHVKRLHVHDHCALRLLFLRDRRGLRLQNQTLYRHEKLAHFIHNLEYNSFPDVQWNEDRGPTNQRLHL